MLGLKKNDQEERIRIEGNGHKRLTLKQRLVRYLLKDAHIDELHIGAHSIVIDGDQIKMSVLATDPATPAEGWIWFLGGATHKPRHHNGTSAKDIGEGATPGAHDLAGAQHNADTLANLNSKVSDATLEDKTTLEGTMDTKIGTHAGVANAHHAKYTDAEAQATVKTNVEVGDLKTLTKALAMNSQKISGLATATVAGEAIAADANIRAPDSSKLEGSTKTEVQNHTPASHDKSVHSDIDQSLLSTDNVAFAQVTVGDLVLKNGYRFTEHKNTGFVLSLPKENYTG